jgi:hypothetical protein
MYKLSLALTLLALLRVVPAPSAADRDVPALARCHQGSCGRRRAPPVPFGDSPGCATDHAPSVHAAWCRGAPVGVRHITG